MGICHCITNPDIICYVVAKAHLCNRCIEDTVNAQLIKNNSYRYKKSVKDKAQRSKASKRMDEVIWKLKDEVHKQEQLLPMIQIAEAMVANTESDESADDGYRESGSEWYAQMEDKLMPAVHILNDKPPSEPPNRKA